VTFSDGVTGETVTLTGSIALIKADQVAAPPFRSNMGHSANLGCGRCFCPKDKFFDVAYDIDVNARRQSQQAAFRADLDSKDPTDAERAQASTDTGWRSDVPPLHGVHVDCCVQLPQEPYHLLLENLAKSLILGMYRLLLNAKQQRMVDARFHALDYPRGMQKIPFPFNTRLPERFGMMQFFNLTIIAPHIFRGILDDQHLATLLHFADLVTLTFQPSTDRATVDRIAQLVKLLLPKLEKLKREHNFKIGGPSAHALLHLVRDLRVFGCARLIGAQREEAKHGEARRAVPFTVKHKINKQLIEKAALAIGMRTGLHGTRFRADGTPDAQGEFRAGRGWTDRLDPRDSSLSHPLLRALSHFAPLTGEPDPSWILGGRGTEQTGKPTVQLSDNQAEAIADVYERRGVTFDRKSMTRTAVVCSSLTAGDQTYRAGDDIRFQAHDSDLDRNYTWYAKVDRMVVHRPNDDNRAVFLWLRYYKECTVGSGRKLQPARGTFDRRIVRLNTDAELLPVSPLVIEGPVAVFHYCRVADEDDEIMFDAEEELKVAAKTAFADGKALERHGPKCGVGTASMCRVHKDLHCARDSCSADSAWMQVDRYKHDERRNLWAVEDRWTGHG